MNSLECAYTTKVAQTHQDDHEASTVNTRKRQAPRPSHSNMVTTSTHRNADDDRKFVMIFKADIVEMALVLR
jgi:hypothetical protein